MINEKIIKGFKHLAEVALKKGYRVKLNGRQDTDLISRDSRSILILQFFKDAECKNLDWMITVEDNLLQPDYYTVGLEQKQHLDSTASLGVKYRRVCFKDIPTRYEYVLNDKLRTVVSALEDWRKNRKTLQDISNSDEAVKPNLLTEEYLYFKESCEELIGTEAMVEIDTISTEIHNGVDCEYGNLYYNTEGSSWRV